jgi:hypothetical protein
MTPILASANTGDGAVVNAEPCAKLLNRAFSGAYLAHEFGRKPRAGYSFSFGVSILVNSVRSVVLTGPKEQMPHVDACGVIASVAHLLTGRDGTVALFPHPSVNTYWLRATRQCAVSVFVALALPQPTRILIGQHWKALCDSFFQRYSWVSHSTSIESVRGWTSVQDSFSSAHFTLVSA